MSAAAGQSLTPRHIHSKLTHAQPVFPPLYAHVTPLTQAVLGVGWLTGQALLQYQMPRSHVQRYPFASHRDSPVVLQAAPMTGSDATVSHWGTEAVPPVVLPPVAPPPVLVPPAAVPPVFAPPVPGRFTQICEAQVSPELQVLLP